MNSQCLQATVHQNSGNRRHSDNNTKQHFKNRHMETFHFYSRHINGNKKSVTGSFFTYYHNMTCKLHKVFKVYLYLNSPLVWSNPTRRPKTRKWIPCKRNILILLNNGRTFQIFIGSQNIKTNEFKAEKLERNPPNMCLAFQHGSFVDLKMFILKKLVAFYTAIQNP